MEKLDFEILGRKIFFLYPPSLIQEEIIFDLSSREYEVYVLTSHEKTKAILRQNPDSICFINIDTILSDEGWKSYIRGIFMDSSLKSTQIGIITNTVTDDLKKIYTSFGIQCGFISTKKGVTDCLKELIMQLESKQAKGRRKYVRAYCEKDPLATINYTILGERINLKIRDISSVGFSCITKGGPISGITKNSVLRDAQLSLRGTLIRCSSVVFAVKETEMENSYVMLFTKEMDSITKDKVRSYIRIYLQNIIESIKE